MDDKAIRRILLSFLLVRNRNARIYQEKSIGSSICDVMAVTDHLTGYEIKSDRDNFDRLDRQIQAYDRFFDRNYLVITEKNRDGAEKRIPYYWGILVVDDGNIYFARTARNNASVSRRSQLTMLWKLELKNLLIRHELPLFAQKSKIVRRRSSRDGFSLTARLMMGSNAWIYSSGASAV